MLLPNTTECYVDSWSEEGELPHGDSVYKHCNPDNDVILPFDDQISVMSYPLKIKMHYQQILRSAQL